MNYVVYAYSFRSDSGGIIVLHKLCHLLNSLGECAYLWPVGNSFYNFQTNPKYNTPIAHSPDLLKNAIVIYPEVISGNPLDSDNVVRWLLNKPNFFFKNTIFGENDLFFYFSKFFNDAKLNKNEDNQLTVMELYDDIFKNYEYENRNGVCFTIRKRKNPKIVHDLSNSLEIKDSTPSKNLADIFNRHKYFISYDIVTYLSSQAALCGCISIVVPEEGVTKEQWRETGTKYGIAYGFEDEEIQHAIKTMPLLLPYLKEIEENSIILVKKFIEKTKNYFSTKNRDERFALNSLNRASQLLNLRKFEFAFTEIYKALKYSQSEATKDALLNTFLFHNFEEKQRDQEVLIAFLDKNNSASQWLEISEENLESAFSGELGNKHRELLASGIKQLLLSSEEKQFISELNQYIAKGWMQDKIAQHFLAASLYCYPHQLPERWFENAEVPEFLVDYFVNFMFETPSFFKELGEADQYCQYVKEWVDFLHLCITTETDSPIWQQMAWVFTQRANFIPLYFNSQNLKEIYVKRAEIMEIALKQRGFQIDFNFPKRDQTRKKIRVGFLSNHFTPLTETFSTLPAFEYLDRGFEVVLYANIVSGHSLEKYCESRVDRLVCLPEDLNAKIQMIRQDDLDFLFICTNTTAVTNQITILALHKLARVQIATFNSPVTTGMKNIDYYLTGKLTEFENSDHYSENLLFLNEQGYCFNYGDFDPKPTQTFTRQLFDLKEEQTIFISAANFYKLTPELKETWVKVIAQVPNSILILMPFGQSWSNQYPKEALVKSLHLLFEKYTISIDRLKLFDPLPNRIEVREALKIADVYLDSYPYSGTTSLIEPLEIGLPSVVRKGNTLRNRMGAAMLQSIHLSDLVVENEESYINLAVKLGTDEKLRSQYREQILEKMANNPPFLDSRSYSAQIGDVLKQLFDKHL